MTREPSTLGPTKRISAKSGVIPAVSDHSSEIKEFYVAIFLSPSELTCFSDHL